MTPNSHSTFLLALCCSLSFAACSSEIGGENDDPVFVPDGGENGSVHTVFVTPSQLELPMGDFVTAQAIVKRDGDTIEAPIVWASSMAEVATVNASGRVTAVGLGQVQISATSQGQSNFMSLTVTEAEEPVCQIGQGNNADSCTGVTPETWRCVTSSNQGGAEVSQVCRDGSWITFNVSPVDCCACEDVFSNNCCEAGASNPSAGCS